VARLVGAQDFIDRSVFARREPAFEIYIVAYETPERGRTQLPDRKGTMDKKALVLYASYTGNTEKVAVRLESTFVKNRWSCDRIQIRKRSEDILHPRFDLACYDFVCVGSGIRSHLPYNEILNVLRRLRLGADPRYSLRMRDETIPYIEEPLPKGPPPWTAQSLVESHRKIDLGPGSPRAIVFVTYSGCEFGPKEADPSLRLLDLEIEHLGFRCVGHFSCPGRFLDHPMPNAYHGDIRHRPDEHDLLVAERFLEKRLREAEAVPA
jgi:hypothetical protein